MNGHLTRRVTALESRSMGAMPFLVLSGDEAAPDCCDGRMIVRIPWLTVDVAKARGWR
jgi:hypothetical protein